MAWLTYSTTENPAGLCASQFAAASASCSQFAKLLITHIAEQPSLTRISHVSCRCGNVDRLVATRLQLYSLISHHAERPSLTRSSLVSCRCGDVDSLGRYRRFCPLSLSGRCLHAATVVAHLLQSSPRIGHLPPGRYQVLLCCGVLRASASPTWSLPSLKRCGFRSRNRHPPLGRYQVYNHIKKRTI